MEDKLEVGMYVRTKHNGIGKIVEYINDPTNYFFKCYKLDRNCFNCEEYITESDVIGEPSHNPIDLIEEGDYINGLRVEKSKYGELYTSYTYMGGDIGLQQETYTTFLKDYEKDDVYSILTKEQFESMSYEVE